MSNALNNMGNVTSIKGDYHTAKIYLEQSLELRKQLEYQPGVVGRVA